MPSPVITRFTSVPPNSGGKRMSLRCARGQLVQTWFVSVPIRPISS